MVSLVGWLDGITATVVIFMAVIFGLLSFYHAEKLKAKLLAIAGLMMIFSGLLYLGPAIDFFSILFTGSNIDNSNGLYGILSYMWIAPALIPAIYLGSELIVPKRKWTIVGIYTILGVIFELFLWLDTANTFIFTLDNPGQDLIDSSFNRTSPAFFLIATFLISLLGFLGIGFAIKAKQATGELRRKFLFLSLAFIIFVASGIFETLIAPGIGLFFVRSGMIVYAAFTYLGLKT